MSDREILFRGQRLDNGEWVESPYPFGTIVGGVVVHDFDPTTVGQYTSMTDRHGTRIFEGDIVSFTRINALGYTTHRTGEVKYHDELPVSYVLANAGDAWDWCALDDIAVIGNRWNDPELMGGDTNA